MIGRLEREVMDHGLDDIIQLEEIVSIARFDIGVEVGSELFMIVKNCLVFLLNEGLAIFGDLDDSKAPLTIEPWPGSGDAIAERVITEWKALGREPNLNEIGWLELTHKGRTQAQEMLM